MDSFSSSASLAINRDVETERVVATERHDKDLNFIYEIERCADWIEKNGYTKVCLQFPDYMLHDSVQVALLFEEKLGFKPMILADNSFGSCCVDIISAQHVEAECIIHYGHSCLSAVEDFPIQHVYDKKPIDTENFLKTFKNTFVNTEQKIVLVYDDCYNHAIGQMIEDLSPKFGNLMATSLRDSTASSEVMSNCACVIGRLFPLAEISLLQDYTMVFIGGDGRTLYNVGLSIPYRDLYFYDPEGNKILEKYSLNTSQFLRKRSFLIETVKAAKRIGILTCAHGTRNFLWAVDRIKQLAARSGKARYTIHSGRPTPEKLANFPDIDVFVLVACPENLILDSKDFFQPIVTLSELEMACNPSREWNANFVLEFEKFLPGGSEFKDMSPNLECDTLETSLVTGRVCSTSETSNTVAIKSDGTVLAEDASGSQFLFTRSWKGLDPRLGQNTATLAEPGRSGTASSYNTDRETLK